ncbi:septation protein A [Methylophaga nitratireducenticrescens]|uniref:Inner membrane-spanning protein YciB n=1 Tax=Methylophaga nitratireducenticrescens TaxID=754476 RepID=I1XLH2_METNJ|nr:septation protein A [Methylophaga nitratireducenticrescens]AFI85241.1 septation protein A [Methylophaga nitratireducenticrescens]AUZ85724.1 septation protein A [Methylophaga nitratireducenticrescens]
MKLFTDFLPIILFFIAYKFGGGIYHWNGQEYEVAGIYAATAVMMVATLVQVLYGLLRHGKVERQHLITFILVMVLGGATLWLQNPEFVMWKPTAVNWLFALAFIGARLFTDKTLLERLMAAHLQLPTAVWSRLNTAWILFFIFSGFLNIYIAYYYSEETWVNFKLFGSLAITVLFIAGQAIYLSRHINDNNDSKDAS